jgi:hypothetical protein
VGNDWIDALGAAVLACWGFILVVGYAMTLYRAASR